IFQDRNNHPQNTNVNNACKYAKMKNSARYIPSTESSHSSSFLPLPPPNGAGAPFFLSSGERPLVVPENGAPVDLGPLDSGGSRALEPGDTICDGGVDDIVGTAAAGCRARPYVFV